MTDFDIFASVSYTIKRAQAALRAAMDGELRPLGLGVAQYACLEQLRQRPGQSNAELARAAFVSRQAMHQLLAGLRAGGLVSVSGAGREARFACTELGHERVLAAGPVAAAIEERMLSGLTAPERRRLLNDVERCAGALGEPAGGPPSAGDESGH